MERAGHEVPLRNYFKGNIRMRWAVESELPNSEVMLCLFSAEDENKAQEYLSYMRSVGHTKIFTLKSLPEDITVVDLKILFPRVSAHGGIPRDLNPHHGLCREEKARRRMLDYSQML